MERSKDIFAMSESARESPLSASSLCSRSSVEILQNYAEAWRFWTGSK
jgi:hypothetical protein